MGGGPFMDDPSSKDGSNPPSPMFADLGPFGALPITFLDLLGVSTPPLEDGRHFLIRNGPILLMACAALLAVYLAICMLRRKNHWLLSLPLAIFVASGGLMALGIGTLTWYDVSEALDQQIERETAARQTLD